jgi:translation elongation factor EF-Ts
MPIDWDRVKELQKKTKILQEKTGLDHYLCVDALHDFNLDIDKVYEYLQNKKAGDTN